MPLPTPQGRPLYSQASSPRRNPESHIGENQSVDSISKSLGNFYMSASNTPSLKAGSLAGPKLVTVNENQDDITSVIRLDNSQKFGSARNHNPFVETTASDVGSMSMNGYPLSLRESALSPEDLRKLNDPKTKRLVNASQIFFLDYYFDLLTYLHNRQLRLQKFKQSTANLPSNEQLIQWRNYTGRERAYLRKRRTRLRYGDFDILTQVGQGGYGYVYLARKHDTKEICALKVMKKRLLFKLDEIRHVLTERDILTTANSPWLVKLLYAFQDPERIYLAMEYVPGGDYRTLLNNTGTLNSRHARFYISEMFSAVESLHKLGYIHRDLKPENFLIDATGHVKLTDFGLSAGALSKDRFESMRVRLDAVKNMPIAYRSISERQSLYRSLREKDLNYANSVVGSPDYMALDVLEGKQYDYTIDYWSLGCMLFESLCGYPPFTGATSNETYSNLRCWKQVLRRPVYDNNQVVFSDRTWDLITRLIADSQHRLHSIHEVHNHPYFNEVNWAHIREVNPPFVPELDSDVDTGYFDDFSNQEDMEKYREVHDKQAQLEKMADSSEKMSRGAFVGFTFRHSKALSVLENSQLNETSHSHGGAREQNLLAPFRTMF
ncbi:kinase-like domain-containing protein [Limtongia smithiae]|uniref:kinase-like domain-containing protein n=1 Tax=Limtongia smithiae TaxID=1125753 RepID=UPI0034CD2ADB